MRISRHLLAGISAALLGGTLVVGSVPAATPASAEEPVFAPVLSRSWMHGEGGSLPECGPRNINGRGEIGGGSPNRATWRVSSTLPNGATVQVGDEWVIRGEVIGVGANAGNNGPDPLVLRLPITFNALPTAAAGEWGANPGDVLGGGDDFKGSVGPYSSVAWEFDGNSKPGAFDSGDGVDARFTMTVRAVAPGQVHLPRMEVFGYDSTPVAGKFDCDFAVGFAWTVEPPPLPPVSGVDVGVTDASYAFASFGDANGGRHEIAIDVLSNDDDPSTPGGVGSPSEVRIADWDSVSVEGGTVSCGTPAQKGTPHFVDSSVGPCRYRPPVDFKGFDGFHYVTRSSSGLTAEQYVVVEVKPNYAPIASPPDLAMSLSQTIVDGPLGGVHDADPFSCSLVTGPAGLTVDPGCTFDFDPAAAGEASFVYRACDTHAHVTNFGPMAERAIGYEDGDPDDLSPTTTRRCRDFAVPLTVVDDDQFYPMPPAAAADVEVVDAGYSSDGVGPYSVVVPVLANDIDLNGPAPSDPGWAGVLDLVDTDGVIETAAVTAGTATVDVVGGQQVIRFTPADGFAGDVQIEYRACENGEDQSPDYVDTDDPNTLPVEAPFCGLGVLALTVVPNEAPLLQDDAVLTGHDAPVSDLDVGANDADPEGGALTCTPGSLSAPAELVTSATIDDDCLVDLTPAAGADGVAQLAYEACDAHELSSPTSPADPYGADGRSPGDPAPRCSMAVLAATIVGPAQVDPGILELDPAPTCAADAATTTAGEPVDVAVLANDSDLDVQGQPGPLTVASAGTEGSEDVSGAGGSAVVDGAGAHIRYTPPAGFTGTDTFVYAAQDAVGHGCTAAVTVTVTGSRDARGDRRGRGTLPATGLGGPGDGVRQAQLGLGLALVGAGLVLAGRSLRRRT